MKRRLLALMLFAAMALALAACGGGENPKGTIAEATEAETAVETTAAETVEETTEAAPETTIEETSEEATEEETEEFELGTVNGLVYENNYLGIGCNLPEGWVAYTDEQLAELNGIMMDNIDESIKEQIENANYFYDMMVADETGANNMNIILQKLNFLQAAGVSDVEGALSATEEDLKTALESMGAENIEFKIDRGQEFPAENYACGVVKGDFQGNTLNERLILFKKGDYLVNITIATFGEDLTKDIAAGFYALD